MNASTMLDFRSDCGECTLTFEDNGRVAYAYLKAKEGICGAVWLYNRCTTPQSPEWHDRSKIPFANCAGYMCEEGRMEHDLSDDSVFVDWERDENGPVAYVYVGDDLYGVVGVGDKPGYARYAIKDNPLARRMEIE